MKIENYINSTYLIRTMESDEEIKFVHRISKGSKYNQIYVPLKMSGKFEVGDMVEVKLLKIKNKRFYSKKTKKLSEFKEKIISEIFSILSKNKKIEQIIVFGSFLTKNVDYNDVDVLILGEEEIEYQVYNDLIGKINMKFHVICLKKEAFERVLKTCPLIRSMMHHFVSSKKLDVPSKTEIDENHLRYLLMMPEDLLKIKFDNGKVYYDSLRKLVSIEHFLKKNEIAPDKIDGELLKSMEKNKLDRIKKNLTVNNELVKEINGIIREKLKGINQLIENGKK